MSACKIAELETRTVIEVGGPEATHFLQGLVTGNVEGLEAGEALHAALLTPQGKILFDFMLAKTAQAYLLDCRHELTGELIKRLTFYKLRAKVDIADRSGALTVLACWGGEPRAREALACFSDPRLAVLGHRLVVDADTDIGALGCDPASEADYHAHRISLGVPEGGLDFEFGEAFPHDADFDQLGGIDFAKGCFVGQEVVSRMQHRGTARKRIVPVEADAPLEPGAAIIAGDSSIGTVGSVAGKAALALIRLDRAEKAVSDGRTLQAGGISIRLLQPPWAKFAVPGAGDEAA